MPNAPRQIPIELAKTRLSYDPETGILRWRVQHGRARVGAVAGSIQEGRRVVSLDGRLYKSARIIWAMMTGRQPVGEIDHRNKNGVDDRWANLREATPAQNRMNTGPRRTGKSGLKGVSFSSKANRWSAEIQADKKRVWLGYHETKEQAAAAYAAAASRLHGAFARTI